MNIEHPLWDNYETLFTQLAESAQKVDRPEPALDQCRYYLCFYGENGMPPEEELSFLQAMQQPEHRPHLKKIEVDTAYWQDTVLFVP